MNNTNLDQRRKRIETVIKIAAMLVTGFFVAPFIFISIKGLFGLLVAAVFGVAAINLAPWFASMCANWRLKALKAEAMKNPVETLQNDYRIRQENLAKYRESIVQFAAGIKNYEDRFKTFQKQHPDDAMKFAATLLKMKQLLDIRTKKYQDAERGLKEYEIEIEKAGAVWEMSVESAKLNKLAGVDTDEFERQLQSKTAIGSIQTSLNMAFSELELSLQEEAAHAPPDDVIHREGAKIDYQPLQNVINQNTRRA